MWTVEGELSSATGFMIMFSRCSSVHVGPCVLVDMIFHKLLGEISPNFQIYNLGALWGQRQTDEIWKP